MAGVVAGMLPAVAVPQPKTVDRQAVFIAMGSASPSNACMLVTEAGPNIETGLAEVELQLECATSIDTFGYVLGADVWVEPSRPEVDPPSTVLDCTEDDFRCVHLLAAIALGQRYWVEGFVRATTEAPSYFVPDPIRCEDASAPGQPTEVDCASNLMMLVGAGALVSDLPQAYQRRHSSDGVTVDVRAAAVSATELRVYVSTSSEEGPLTMEVVVTAGNGEYHWNSVIVGPDGIPQIDAGTTEGDGECEELWCRLAGVAATAVSGGFCTAAGPAGGWQTCVVVSGAVGIFATAFCYAVGCEPPSCEIKTEDVKAIPGKARSVRAVGRVECNLELQRLHVEVGLLRNGERFGERFWNKMDCVDDDECPARNGYTVPWLAWDAWDLPDGCYKGIVLFYGHMSDPSTLLRQEFSGTAISSNELCFEGKGGGANATIFMPGLVA